MKTEKLEEVKLLVRSNVATVVPDSTVNVASYKRDWVCFYYYPFNIGLIFPFSKLIVDVLKALKVSSGQLIPFASRAMACLDALEEKHQVKINVEVVKHSYSLKKFSDCSIGFVNRTQTTP